MRTTHRKPYHAWWFITRLGALAAGLLLVSCERNAITQPGSHGDRQGWAFDLSQNRPLSSTEIAASLASTSSVRSVWDSQHPSRRGGFTTSPHAEASFTLPIATDTLFGYLNTSIGGTSASAAGSSRASEHRSVATVISQGWGHTQVGTALPVSWDDYCDGSLPNPEYCSWGQNFSVDCSLTSSIDAHANFVVSYAEGTLADGDGASNKDCDESPGGGGEGGGVGSPDCDSYVVEISYDGGATWSELGTFTACE